ncbi:MAG: hypothetical protein D6B27_02635 [Gammaproteobacteria bacterium]|nr:MAG: hypothetical protein D6B27_02635 [Gammaproteobacteria bacterium]
MQELFEKIKSTLRSIWRFRWVLLIFAWVIGGAGWIFIFTLPDQYKAETKIFADTDSIVRMWLGSMVTSGDYQATVNKVKEQLLSRPNMKELIHSVEKLHLSYKTDQEEEALVNQLRKRINIKVTKRGTHYHITFIDEDANLAKEVVERMQELFKQKTLKNNRTDVDKAELFLDDQITEYREKLEEKENELKEFKRKNVGKMPGSSGDYYSNLQRLQEKLSAEKLKMQEKINSRDALKKQLQKEIQQAKQASNNAADLVPHKLDAEIKQYEQNLQNLLLSYTENHPDVIRTKEVIAQLKAKKAAEIKQHKKTTGNNLIVDSIASQELKKLLGQTESELAIARTRVNEYQSRIDKLKKQMDTLPKIETELIHITRDYNIIKNKYEELVSRKESARIDKNVNEQTNSVNFQSIEPPFVHSNPVGPPRLIYSSVALLFALGSGIFFSFFLSQIKPVFDNSRNLALVTGYPVLGSVSMVTSVAYRVKRKIEVLTYLLGILVFFASYGGVILLQYYQKDLIGYITKMAGIE